MKRLILQSMRDHWPKPRFGLEACTITVLLLVAVFGRFLARGAQSQAKSQPDHLASSSGKPTAGPDRIDGNRAKGKRRKG